MKKTWIRRKLVRLPAIRLRSNHGERVNDSLDQVYGGEIHGIFDEVQNPKQTRPVVGAVIVVRGYEPETQSKQSVDPDDDCKHRRPI